jgi:hypothetical protein
MRHVRIPATESSIASHLTAGDAVQIHCGMFGPNDWRYVVSVRTEASSRVPLVWVQERNGLGVWFVARRARVVKSNRPSGAYKGIFSC